MLWGTATVGISDPVTIAILALVTGAIPSLNALFTWYTSHHAKQSAGETKEAVADNSTKLDKLQVTVNGRLDGLMRENMNLRKALQVAHDANEQLRTRLADESGGQH